MDEYMSKEDYCEINCGKENREGYKTCKNCGMLNVPAADVQPVVHCKDCKHRKERHYEESGEKPYIKYECKFTKYSMSDNGFCSFGARMDGDKNG